VTAAGRAGTSNSPPVTVGNPVPGGEPVKVQLPLDGGYTVDEEYNLDVTNTTGSIVLNDLSVGTNAASFFRASAAN